MPSHLTIKNLDPGYKIRGLSEVHPQLPKPFFCTMIQGSPGSGKTTMALNMIKFYRSFHDLFIFVSPSAGLDPKVVAFVKRLRERGKPVILITKIKTGVMERVKELISDPEHASKHKLLFVDDVSGNANVLAKGNAMEDLCMNRRHLKLNIMLMLHTYKSAPKKFRLNSCTHILFDSSRSDIKEIMEERDVDLDSEAIRSLRNRDYLVISHANKTIRHMLEGDEFKF